MGDIEVRPVRGRGERRLFAAFPWTVMGGDPLWVPPLLRDRLRALEGRVEFMTHGEAEFFLAWRDGRPVGTICAAEDFAANSGGAGRKEARRDCVFGFLDFLDEPGIFPALVAAAAAWARSRGLTELLGPFNLDYEDGYGVLLEGRDRPPVLLCGHSPAYYLPAYESLGFLPARGDNIAFELRLDRPIPERERLASLAAAARKRSGFTTRSADFSHLDREVENVHSILDRSLRHLPGYIPWERSAVEALLSPFARYARPEEIVFAEKDGEVVGFLPAIPDLNEALVTLDGLRKPSGWARLPFAFRRQYECVTVKTILVPPEYWSTGLVAVLFDELLRKLEGKGYSWMDLSLTSDDNPTTPALATRFGGRIYKRYRVFRRGLEGL